MISQKSNNFSSDLPSNDRAAKFVKRTREYSTRLGSNRADTKDWTKFGRRFVSRITEKVIAEGSLKVAENGVNAKRLRLVVGGGLGGGAEELYERGND